MTTIKFNKKMKELNLQQEKNSKEYASKKINFNAYILNENKILENKLLLYDLYLNWKEI